MPGATGPVFIARGPTLLLAATLQTGRLNYKGLVFRHAVTMLRVSGDPEATDRILSLEEVAAQTPWSKSTLYREASKEPDASATEAQAEIR